MSTDRLNVESNERIDISDFRFLAGEGVQANLRQIGHQFFMEESVSKPQDQTGYILGGFKIENLTLKQLKVNKGKALLSQRLNGTVVRGIVTTTGDDSITEDLNAYAYGTYGVYIRFEEVSSQPQGRIFWNPTGNGNEYTDEIPTRLQARWSMRVELASPGSEWLKIGEVVVSSDPSLALTDMRPFYYEGSAVDSAYLSGWGSAALGGSDDDRDADRGTHGVTDLHTFTRAMRQCLEDIKGRGLRRWWDADIGGMNIGFDDDPEEGRLAVGDAAFYLKKLGSNPFIYMDDSTFITYNRSSHHFDFTANGSLAFSMYDDEVISLVDLIPEPTGSISLGTYLKRWNSIYGNSLTLGAYTGATSTVLNLKCDGDNKSISIMGNASTDNYAIGMTPAGALMFLNASGDFKMGLDQDGFLLVGTHSAVAAETVSGYITIKDSGGVARKLAVIS